MNENPASISTVTINAEPADERAVESDSVSSARPTARRKTKSRVILNFWLDALLLVAVVFIGWVSALLHIIFPAPTAADGWILWGLSYDQWNDVRSTALCLCALLALEHVVLHWNWVCNTIATRIFRTKSRPDEGAQALYGIGTFIVVMLVVFGSVVAAMLSVKRPGP